MIRLRHKLFIQFFRLFDLLLLVGTLIAVVGIVVERGDYRQVLAVLRTYYHLSDALCVAFLLLGWTVILNQTIRYNSNRFTGLLPQILDVVKATSLASFFILILGQLFAIHRFNAFVVFIFWVATTVLAILSRVLIRWILTALRRSGRNYRYLLIVGADEPAIELAARIEVRPELGYKIVGLLTVRPTSPPTPPPPSPRLRTQAQVIGALPDLKPILEQGVVDEIMVALPLVEHFPAIHEVIRLGRERGVVVRLLPNTLDIGLIARAQMELFEGQYVITFFRENLLWHLLAKRTLDFVVSLTVLIALSPLLLLVALLIKSTSPGPVFFIQERIGMNKRRFRMYKFRSMFVDAEQRKAELAHLNEMSGPVFKMRNDPRVTPVGRFIRKTSIDELPQLINVLKGDMSLVGPRPPLSGEVDQYEWLDRRRLSIKPGITCLWQISGRNELTFEQWMELDRQYIENWNFWLDLQILLKTIPVVLLGKGAS